MQFTKLQLSGFKSFVDTGELFIEPGVTGIVGPNGCGKSNLVEALRWVMGETSAKRMRGGEMDDVIFSGSATRPARNVAEVVIHLDNRDRSAPALFNDQEALDVVRRIERGAGSSYRVNGREVRARDVQLLFADAATGAHSTAMVSQGRIGMLISAKPADRRALLEEAAGITGLHTRRHEAELRLRAAETNLERLDDVIATLEAQFQGLKKQVRQASRYRNLAEQIRRWEAAALHLEAEAARQAVARTRGQLTEAGAQVAALTEAAATRATEQAEAAAALPELRKAEAEAAAALQRLLVDRDNLAREEAQAAAAKAQAEERHRQLEDDRARAQARAQDAAQAQARLEQERTELEAAAEREVEAIADAQAALAVAREAVAKHEAELSLVAERVAADEARASALERRKTELAARLERLGRQAEEVGRQRAALAEQSLPEDALPAARHKAGAAEAALERARAEAEAGETALGQARGAESAARETLQQAEAARAKLEAEAAALTALLEPAERRDWPPLVDSVTVAPGYEAALGAALGDDIAAPTEAAAPIRWETLRPYDAAAPLPAGAEPLSSYVQGPPALGRRLAQIGVVADAASGARLQPELAPGQRLVTRAGGLWRWDGFTAAEDARTSAGQRLEQRRRLAELRTGLEEAATAAASARGTHEAARAEAERTASAERSARAEVATAFAALNAARQHESELAQRAAAVASRLGALTESGERLEADLTESEAAMAAARGEAERLPDLGAGRAELQRLRAELTERRDELGARQSAADRLAREAEARAARLSAIAQEKDSWAQRSGEAERYLAELAARLEAITQEIEALAARPLELARLREALAEQIDGAESRRKAAADALALGETRLAEADRALKVAEHALAEAREGRVRAEAAVAQAEQALRTLAERARERLDCGLDQLFEAAELDEGQDLPRREDVEAKLARLIRERDNMGPVNLRAEAEARALEEQISGMQSERADLIGAIGRLRQGIASLNREGRERLLAAFAKVDSHFSELFVRLFGGGRAHLKLTEAEDPLDAGLEILASPPGKRLQVLSLLSGGEQALTALALLFAVFLTNPAPICVLDEVDAPLDDANVDRFCSLLDELSHGGTTRFLVITHHRMTMARVDRLFGVTMAERGVSRLVSVDLGAAEDLRESA